MKDLFETPEKAAVAVSLMKRLKDDEAWKIIVSIVQENIEYLENIILSGGQEENLEEIKWLRKARKMHLDFINTPQMIIDRLTSTKGEAPEFDPYITSEEIQKELRVDNKESK